MSLERNVLKNIPPSVVSIWISIGIHIVLLAIAVEPALKEGVKRLPSLDVVLVNARTEKSPDNAELIAQANLDRGGNTDQNKKLKTVLPTPLKKNKENKLREQKKTAIAAQSAQVKFQKEQEEKRITILEKQVQTVMTQLHANRKIASNNVRTATTKEVEREEARKNIISKKLNRDTLLAASLEIERLEAQIARQQQDYQKRPKRRFLGARAKSADDAFYLETWRQKVERVGNMNYPTAGRNKKLYGTLQLTVLVRADGTVEEIICDKSSGSSLLDDAAINIVKLAAPYAKFSQEMKKTTDILGITRTWTFTNENAFYTQ